MREWSRSIAHRREAIAYCHSLDFWRSRTFTDALSYQLCRLVQQFENGATRRVSLWRSRFQRLNPLGYDSFLFHWHKSPEANYFADPQSSRAYHLGLAVLNSVRRAHALQERNGRIDRSGALDPADGFNRPVETPA